MRKRKVINHINEYEKMDNRKATFYRDEYIQIYEGAKGEPYKCIDLALKFGFMMGLKFAKTQKSEGK